MRKTDISQYGNMSDNAGISFKEKRRNKNLRIITSVIRIMWRVFLSLVTVCALTGILVLISLGIYKSTILENDIALNINASKMSLTSFVYVNDENGAPQEYQKVYNLENRVWIDFKDIPQNMKNAIIAIEDKRFYDHKGVDWLRTSGAMLNLLKGTQSYGGSTLTQQLIKNITEDNQVSLTRKLREIFRAIELEERYSKDEILESYLNVVNFGGGSRGVQAAANLYFNKNIQDCSLAQCAAIAAITQNPTAYNPFYHPENNKSRRETVLKEMLEQGKISDRECAAAMEESSTMKFSDGSESGKENSSASVRNWYMEMLIRDVVSDLCNKYRIGKSAAEDMIYTQGLKIYCAMDKNAQSIAEDTLKNSNIMPKDSNLELGYTLMDLNGRILATLGSRKEKTGNLLYDRANVARRQPGSTIKPLAAYTPAIDLGMYNYSSLVPDEPLQIDSAGNNVIKNWPENWYKSYKGQVTLQWAIEKSANAPAAQVVKLLTPFKSYEFLTKKLQINSLDSSDAISLSALATGGTHFGVTPREMTAAFQIFGNGGKYNKPYSYFYVTDRNDKVILDNRDNIPTQAVASTTATIMNRLLRNVVVGPEGTGKSANIPDWDIIGKTGTTTDDHDSWFIGLSPYAVSGIWTGYDNPKRISETAEAIKIWKHIMTKYLEKKSQIDFTYDKDVVTAQYCKVSGKLASSGCTSTATGYYAPNNMPGVCTSHSGLSENSVQTAAAPAGDGNGDGSPDPDERTRLQVNEPPA
jgi:penicillin-binding protein 1A